MRLKSIFDFYTDLNDTVNPENGARSLSMFANLKSRENIFYLNLLKKMILKPYLNIVFF